MNDFESTTGERTAFETGILALENAAACDDLASISRRVRKRPVVLYFGRNTFSDNTKYLYLADTARQTGHTVLWCSAEKTVISALTEAGLPCFDLTNDLDKSIDLLIHAAVAVFCVNPSESLRGSRSFNSCLAGAKKIQLWHGVSVKQLLLKLIPHLGISDNRYRRPFFMASQADMVLSTSSYFDNFWHETYGASHLIRGGYPRNEVLVREASCWFPRGTEPVFPPRSEPPLSMVF